MTDVLFSVLTATFNRSRLLIRVYESLVSQTVRDFEWIVIDDGSTDDTASVVKKWQEREEFPIRYVYQENAGKHFALNRGIETALGKYVLIADSDDRFTPDAMATLLQYWHDLPADARRAFVGVTGLCKDSGGRIVGRRFPQDVCDSNTLEMRYRHKSSGEKWGFQRTEVLRLFPFPEDVAVRASIPESLVWDRIAVRYKTRYINRALRVYDSATRADQITSSSVSSRSRGGRAAAKMVLDEQLSWFRWAPIQVSRSAAIFVRCSLHCDISLLAQWRELRWPARALWMVAAPVGCLYYRRDLRKDQARR